MDRAISQQPARDAQRSRSAILDAAEDLFAERGFQGASLAEIAAHAGLSRATPSYFFSNKESLYVAVLERLFAEREAATREAFSPLLAWAEQGPAGSLRSALTAAVDGYLGFLQRRPAFAHLIQREQLDGGTRLLAVRRESRAMADAFSSLRQVARRRGLRSFDRDDAVLVCVSLTYSPLTQSATFLTALGRDLNEPKTRRRHVTLVVDQLLALIEGHGNEPKSAS
ncbi:MAG TPA: TetR family transcriptional regulator [Solirubrobacteraceae bacterium]|nr:TetR family transcriptional regulator [Solirubrobacteraceae bacterium]